VTVRAAIRPSPSQSVQPQSFEASAPMYVCSMITAASDTNGRMNRIIICAGGSSLGLTMAGRAAVSRQTLQEGQAFPIKAAKHLLLQAPSDHSPQQVLAQSRRRRSSEDHLPTPPKGMKRKRPQVSDLGLDRSRLCPLPPHGPIEAGVRDRVREFIQDGDTVGAQNRRATMMMA